MCLKSVFTWILLVVSMFLFAAAFAPAGALIPLVIGTFLIATVFKHISPIVYYVFGFFAFIAFVALVLNAIGIPFVVLGIAGIVLVALQFEKEGQNAVAV